MSASNLNQLRSLSAVMALASIGVIVVLTVAGFYKSAIWLSDPAAIAADYPGVIASPALLSYSVRIAGIAIAWVSIGLMVYAAVALLRMFRLFAAGRVLDREPAVWLRRAGSTLVALAIYRIFANTATILLLTLGNPDGQRQLTIGLGSDQLFPLFMAGILFAIGHVLALGADVEDENRSFV